MKRYIFMYIFLVCFQIVFAQRGVELINFWEINKSQNKSEWKQKENEQIQAHLNIDKLKKALQNTPIFDRSIGDIQQNKHDQTILQMPMPDGSFNAFRVAEAPVMHAHLAKKFPQLKAYIGFGIDNPTQQLRFDITPKGFNGIILSGGQNAVLIEPNHSIGKTEYLIFSKNRISEKTTNWICGSESKNNLKSLPEIELINKSNACTFRAFRFAIACTGEYAQYHGGTKELALAAIHNSLTRLNGVLERDLSIQLILIPENDQLIFLNAFNDPYSNNNLVGMMTQNQNTIDELIGEDQYDIGHVLATSGGGIAQLESVCKNGQKGRGVTGYATPVGDIFDIDYFAHEIGHQLGARHTHNNNCNRSDPTAVEPGSGSTIMSYAGICAPNVQTTSDAYFHSISLLEISGFLNSGGDNCAQIIAINPSTLANAGQDYSIPVETPFELIGNTMNEDAGEGFTYLWEQIDNEVAIMPPFSGNFAGPLFRSQIPKNEPVRIFPNINTILLNEENEWEVLPSVERELNFRLTIHDYSTVGGCFSMDDVKVNIHDIDGEFKVNNIHDNWIGGEKEKITWNTAGTEKHPINCSFIEILLSTDGGMTFPYTLADNESNTGECYVIVPNVNSSKCRIKIKGKENIFFDVSDFNFSIISSSNFHVDLEINHLKCFDGQDGKITATAIGFQDPYYFWSNGEESDYIEMLTAGEYTVTVSDNQKTAVATGIVKYPENILIDLNIEKDNESNNLVLEANSFGGTGEHKYSWNTGSQSSSTSIKGPGIFQVTITDENSCKSFKDRVITETEIDAKANIESNLKIYPNPSDDFVFISFHQKYNGGPEITLNDLIGNQVYSKVLLHRLSGKRTAKIDISPFPKGLYYLTVTEAEHTQIGKIMIN